MHTTVRNSCNFDTNYVGKRTTLPNYRVPNGRYNQKGINIFNIHN